MDLKNERNGWKYMSTNRGSDKEKIRLFSSHRSAKFSHFESLVLKSGRWSVVPTCDASQKTDTTSTSNKNLAN
jgi:hypothetical protein